MKSFLTQITVTLFLILSFAFSMKTAESETILSTKDLLIENNEITGWSPGGPGWLANNISELTTYIDGMAEIYLRHEFEEAAHRTYQGRIGKVECQLGLTINNQGTEDNAKATYEDPDIGLNGATDWTNGAGQATHYVRYGGLSQVLTFYRKMYFVYLEINCDTEGSLNILKQFALYVDGKIQQQVRLRVPN